MRTAELRYFLASVEAGSFGKAASSLQLRVSTVSRAIARLEDQLGVALFERTSSGIELTTAGRVALRCVRRVLSETNALTETLKRNSFGAIGEVHLGFHLPPVNAFLTNLLVEWRTTYPGVSVTPHEPGERTLHTALIERHIDVALLPEFVLPHRHPHTPIYFEPLMAVLPTAHLLAGKATLQWTDLKGENLLLWSWGKDGIGRDFFATRLPGISMRIFETGNMTLLAFVRAGYGITVAAQTYSTLNLPGLKFIPIGEGNAGFKINLVWRAESEDPIVGKFVAFMRDRARHHHRSPHFRAASESPDPPP